MNKLEVDSIQLSFDGRKILSNIYLQCKTGDIIGILGRNGSGKSSLLKVIFGSLKAENQFVRYNGVFQKQLFKSPNAIHFVTQDGSLMNYLSFSDLVRIFELKSKLDYILEIEEIRKHKDHKLSELSTGVRRLVEIMVFLFSNSAFTILDEPFSGLSPALIEKLIPHIQNQSRKKGIILTDHRYQDVWEVATKKLVLHEGNIKEIFELGELESYGYISVQT